MDPLTRLVSLHMITHLSQDDEAAKAVVCSRWNGVFSLGCTVGPLARAALAAVVPVVPMASRAHASTPTKLLTLRSSSASAGSEATSAATALRKKWEGLCVRAVSKLKATKAP